MVEQYLSQWIDAEIFDVRTIQSLRQHLSDCSACQERLELYRQLQSKILNSRPSYQAISDQEWRETLKAYHRRERRWLVRLILYAAALVLLAVVGIVWLVLVPEKSPNIFELP
jgi:predicted anti-sigma-YlaC factor YlaD